MFKIADFFQSLKKPRFFFLRLEKTQAPFSSLQSFHPRLQGLIDNSKFLSRLKGYLLSPGIANFPWTLPKHNRMLAESKTFLKNRSFAVYKDGEIDFCKIRCDYRVTRNERIQRKTR
jgi:hypothetical protein